MFSPSAPAAASILQLENDHLKFVLNEDATARITVKATGVTWEQGAIAFQEEGDFDQAFGWHRKQRPSFMTYPGQFELRREGEAIRVRLRGGPPQRERGEFLIRYTLEEAWLVLEILEIDDRLPGLVFPPPLRGSALLIPHKQGEIRRGTVEDRPGIFGNNRWERSYLRNPMMNMRWFGGLQGEREQHGYIAILAEGWENSGILASGHLASPVWTQSLGTWQTRRKVRYGFTDQGFVGVAKHFRRWAQSTGLWGRSLREKLDDNPQVDCMIGGRKIRLNLAFTIHPDRFAQVLEEPHPDLPHEGEFRIDFTFREVKELIEAIKGAGMKRGVFKYGGWGKGGYDERHPDIWPPDPRLGTMEEFEAICRQQPPFMSCLHDNYYDVYEHSPGFPKGACWGPDGHPMRVGYWAGGQAYAANTRDMFPWAQENARRMFEAGCRNHYFDSFAFLSQSWEPGNTLTRAEDREWKNRIFDASNALGMVTGSEDGADYYVAHSHWSPKGKWGFSSETVPLWNLVFNDAHIGFRLVNTQSPDPAEDAKVVRHRCLENLLLGFAPTYMYRNREQFEKGRDLFTSTFFVDEWHREIAMEEMVDHQVLSEDCQVRRSVFANGRAVTVNLAKEPRQVEGREMAGESYRME